jgi:uncharacterized protein (DUF433 family)
MAKIVYTAYVCHGEPYIDKNRVLNATAHNDYSSWDEAHQALLGDAHDAITRAQMALTKATKRLARVEGMQPPEEE